MAVVFTSNGYDTTETNPYTETAWADAFPSIGSATYGVRAATDWKVTAVSGQDRTVAIAAGRGFGHGVTDKTVANETIQLSTISSGSRWDLIVCRRDWTPTAGTSKFEKVNGGATATIPGGRLVGPGNIDDQPIALVQVTAGQTQPTSIIDLRTWSGDGGGLVANHDLVRSYMNAAGTRLHINGSTWTRRVGANDTLEWIDEDGSGPWTPLTLSSGWTNTPGTTARARLVGRGAFLQVSGDVNYPTSYGAIQEGWTIAPLPAGLAPADTTYVPGTTNQYRNGTFYSVTPGGIKVGPFPLTNVCQFNGLAAMK